MLTFLFGCVFGRVKDGGIVVGNTLLGRPVFTRLSLLYVQACFNSTQAFHRFRFSYTLSYRIRDDPAFASSNLASFFPPRSSLERKLQDKVAACAAPLSLLGKRVAGNGLHVMRHGVLVGGGRMLVLVVGGGVVLRAGLLERGRPVLLCPTGGHGAGRGPGGGVGGSRGQGRHGRVVEQGPVLAAGFVQALVVVQ